MKYSKNITSTAAKTLAILLLLAFPLSAEKKSAADSGNGGSIVIYKFALKGDAKTIQYYAEILPKTLFQYLKRTGKYNPLLKSETIPPLSLSAPGGSENMKTFKRLAGEAENIHFICSGIIENTPKGPRASIIIYNVKKKRIKVLPAEHLESGAVLGSSMDTLSGSVMKKVDYAVAEARKEASTSPYLSFYNLMSYLSFGLSSGYTFIIGDYGNIYDNDIEVRMFLDVSLRGLLPNLSLRCSGSLYGTSNSDTASLDQRGIKLWSVGGAFTYSLPLSRYFSISAEAGSGAALTTFIDYDETDINSGPAQNRLEVSHTDPYFFTALTLDLHLSPVTISAGSSYRRIFYSNQGMDMVSVFGSVQYRL